MKKAMKNIFKIIKMLIRGVMPAIAGGLIILDIMYFVKNIQNITTGSGWNVVLCFIVALAELFLALALLYELGELQANSNNWTRYLKNIEIEAADTIDGSPEENETSDEAANT